VPSSSKKSTGEAAPGAVARELGADTGWDLWNDALRKQDAQFAHTKPGGPLPAEGGDPRYAKTQPAQLVYSAEDPLPEPLFTLQDVLAVARKGNRVCPRPMRWHELYLQFGNWTPPGTTMPAPPPHGSAWRATPPLAMRMMFRDHVEWAEQYGCLAELMMYLQSMAEEHWYHIGD